MRNSILLLLGCAALLGVVQGQSYDDFSWVKKFAAVGDSFTAGIGAGGLYSAADSDAKCARYDQAYPVLMYRFLPSVQNFEYLACSGDKSADIIGQINIMTPGQDLVVLTAGGNDLCLSSIITTCILQRFASETDCQNILSQASAGATGFLQNNIIALIEAIDAKMNQNGVIILSTYAPYFNSDTAPCGTTENWGWPFGGLKLTTDHRQQFNNLVIETNNALVSAVQSAKTQHALVKVSDWSSWGGLTGGRFCEPGASPVPTDPSNAAVMFFKWDSSPVNLGDVPVGPLRIRGNLTSHEDSIVEGSDLLGVSDVSVVYEETAMERRREKESKRDLEDLVRRGITTITCPATSWISNAVQYFLTDETGKVFHPNQLGHQVMASFALDQVEIARADILAIPAPGCVGPILSCYQKSGSTAYASAYSLYSNTQDFCSSAVNYGTSATSTDWLYTKSYNVGTLDESNWAVQLSNGASILHEDDCLQAMNQLLDSCDIDSSNPMNWKFGGRNAIASYGYTITPVRQNRPQPPPSSPKQSCNSGYKFLFDHYDIYGAGWATWDWGQQTLRPNSTSCFGLGLTGWNFQYFDEPDSNGYEWHAWFNSPIWTRARCYNNNKVQNAAGGGGSGGCQGSG